MNEGMSRSKLRKFTGFANTLLPHETAWLLSIEEFQDPVRLAILQHIHQFTSYDEGFDKRKYSNLKNWIQSRLKAIDVDEQFLWMSRMEQHIMTDALKAFLFQLTEPLLKEEEKHHLHTDAFSQVNDHIPDILHTLKLDLHARGFLV